MQRKYFFSRNALILGNLDKKDSFCYMLQKHSNLDGQIHNHLKTRLFENQPSKSSDFVGSDFRSPLYKQTISKPKNGLHQYTARKHRSFFRFFLQMFNYLNSNYLTCPLSILWKKINMLIQWGKDLVWYSNGSNQFDCQMIC